MTQAIHNLESMLEHLPVGIVVLDAGLEIKNCNELAMRLLNVNIENMLTGNFLEAIGDARLKESLLLVHEGKQQQCHLMLDSMESLVSCTIKSMPGDSGNNDLLISIEDATQLRDLERVKREFIESLLHKIRNPLATLTTSLAMVQEGRMGALPPDAQEILGMGYHEASRLSILLNDVRNLFLIETGLAAKDLVIETFSIADVLDRAVAGLVKMGPTLDAVKIRLSQTGNLDAKVSVDFDKTKKILTNLLKNALQYSHNNGPIELSVALDENNATIQIRDYGQGIAKDKLPLLFTKFYREDTPITRVVEGNGLGLFIARSFADLMAGSLYCMSEPGKGSTFFLTLPLARR